MKKVISSKNAPKATGPFSQAVFHDSRLHLELSGQLGISPGDGKLVEGGAAAQARQALENIGAILAEVGWNFSNVVKVRIFLADMTDYKAVNEIYAAYFPADPPARVAVAVKQLPLGGLVEIECVAAGDE